MQYRTPSAEKLWQRFEEKQVVRRQALERVADEARLLRLDALLCAPQHLQIVIAADTPHAVRFEHRDRLVRIESVVHDIAGAEDQIRIRMFLQHGLQTDDVGVHVRDQQDLHIGVSFFMTQRNDFPITLVL